MVDDAFQSASIEVAVGTTVFWTNQGAGPHTSTSGTSPAPSGLWDSGVMQPGNSFARTFDEPGTFSYFCQVDPVEMQGTVVVG